MCATPNPFFQKSSPTAMRLAGGEETKMLCYKNNVDTTSPLHQDKVRYSGIWYWVFG